MVSEVKPLLLHLVRGKERVLYTNPTGTTSWLGPLDSMSQLRKGFEVILTTQNFLLICSPLLSDENSRPLFGT